MALRKSVLLVAIALVAMSAVTAFVVYQGFIGRHRYPQDALREASNLSVRGIVTSIEQDHVTRGMVFSNYHIFRLYIQLNITEVVWTDESYLNSSIGGDEIFGSNSIVVGYDYSDSPQLAIAQEIECKGFYLGLTDTSFSFVLTVAPSVSGSYLKPQV